MIRFFRVALSVVIQAAQKSITANCSCNSYVKYRDEFSYFRDVDSERKSINLIDIRKTGLFYNGNSSNKENNASYHDGGREKRHISIKTTIITIKLYALFLKNNNHIPREGGILIVLLLLFLLRTLSSAYAIKSPKKINSLFSSL